MFRSALESPVRVLRTYSYIYRVSASYTYRYPETCRMLPRMLSRGSGLFSPLPPPLVKLSARTYQNFVMSNALANLEKECERYCPTPRFPIQKVCVCGAGTDIGRIACLFLKQQKVIRNLAMYDDIPERFVLGVANDIAHIDTSTEVEAYQGRAFLKTALHNADVVLVCGGCHVMPPACDILDRDLFLLNMQFVRTVALAVAQFCPYTVVAVQTPPVDCNFTLIKHTLELNHTYDKRRVLGVNSVNSMRANQLFCSITGSDPKASNIPVICGTCKTTRVPVFSAGKPGNVPQTQVDCLSRLVREADDIICRVKSNNEQGHLSIGFATARFVINIMKGLYESPTFIDSALVEQADSEKCFGLKYCATPVTVGKGGVVQYAIPQINGSETRMLEESKCDLKDNLELGRCFALGEEYFIDPCTVKKVPRPKPCSTCEVCK